MVSNETSTPLIVSLNASKVLEYRRERELSGRQTRDLQAIDDKLSTGIHIAGKFISAPSDQEKAVFIAHQLANALQQDNDSIIALSLAYLAVRYPALKQLKLTQADDQLSLELINDREYAEQAPLRFVDKKDLL